jgi:leader peptidase (prepilin peptidase)/N-methyltransferase
MITDFFDPLLVLLQQSPTLFITTLLVLGLLVGSFLNVVIYRLPVMMQREWELEAAEILEQEPKVQPPFSLTTPASHCPKCKAPVKPWQNIPIVSWLLLGGKCALCKTPISKRYPTIELVSGLMTAAVAWIFGWSDITLVLIPFMWVTLALTMIDFDTQLLPDTLVMPLLWLGMLINISGTIVPLREAVVGAMAGYLSLWSVYWAFKLITGKEGMGYGDFKLLAAFGAWFGWQALPLIILLSAAVGAVVGIALMVILGRDKNIPIPFGPYLCGAAWVYVFFGPNIMTWYLGSY